MSACRVCYLSLQLVPFGLLPSTRTPEGLSARERCQVLVLRNRGGTKGNPFIHWVFIKHLLCADLCSRPWGSALSRNSTHALPCVVHTSSHAVPGSRNGLEMQTLGPRRPSSKAPGH